MDIDIVYATDRPIDLISQAAGTSYEKTDSSFQRVRHCFLNRHMSVFEHAGVTFYISGISRACSHQLVRHRMASFIQKSQRYTKGDQTFILPDTIAADPALYEIFDNLIEHAEKAYKELLEYGVPAEDARYVLPEATTTKITMTTNVRELFHFFDLRCDKTAQWEIRNLANKMKDILYNHDEQWRQLIELYDGDIL